MSATDLGVLFYRGPSLLTGAPVVGIVSGLEGESKNPKTGPMVRRFFARSSTVSDQTSQERCDGRRN